MLGNTEACSLLSAEKRRVVIDILALCCQAQGPSWKRERKEVGEDESDTVPSGGYRASVLMSSQQLGLPAQDLCKIKTVSVLVQREKGVGSSHRQLRMYSSDFLERKIENPFL